MWNLWWMRRVLATPGLPYFHTTYLFYPFGAPLANHPHTALPALVAATLLAPTSPLTAQNILLLTYVFANMAAMYALAWAITRRLRASMLAAIIFGLSPYIAVHLLGHFDLVAAFTIPLYALALRAALVDAQSSRTAERWCAFAAGSVLAATAYIAYYHVVFLAFFTVVYSIARVNAFAIVRRTTPVSPASRRVRKTLLIAAAISAGGAAAIVVSGGVSIQIAGATISARTPQNVLTAAWLFVITAGVLTWRPRIQFNPGAAGALRRVMRIVAEIAVVFLILSSPLVREAVRLVFTGEYVTQKYGWRSIPHGVDLIAPALGHPLHPLFGAASTRAYQMLGQNFIEVIAWFGVVPMALLLGGPRMSALRAGTAGDRFAEETRTEYRAWRFVAIAFAVWALGPFLTVAGFDTGLKLPAILLHYVPFVENARMPGRAVVCVYMAVGLLLAIRIPFAAGRLRSPALQWIVIAAVVFEYWAAPLRLTAIDRPAVYQTLAASPPGGVCEVPMGIGDGLSEGIGSQDRRILLYATQHQHPLVGGYIGRMPADAAERIRALPVAGTLLALSSASSSRPAAQISDRQSSAGSPCVYLVIHRSALTPLLAEYLQKLTTVRIASDDQHDLLRIH